MGVSAREAARARADNYTTVSIFCQYFFVKKIVQKNDEFPQEFRHFTEFLFSFVQFSQRKAYFLGFLCSIFL